MGEPFEAIEQQLVGTLFQVPVGRIDRPDDIAHAVCMIASLAPGLMTGANIRVEGGQIHAVN